jgi:hypothetical protein
MDDFPGPKAMAVHLNGLMDNETAYLEHHAWRWQWASSHNASTTDTTTKNNTYTSKLSLGTGKN